MAKKYFLNLTVPSNYFDKSKLHICFEYTDLDGNQIEGVYQRDDDIQGLLEYFSDNLVYRSHEESTIRTNLNGYVDITKPINIKIVPDKQ